MMERSEPVTPRGSREPETELHSQSPLMSATHRILPVFPERTTRGGEDVEDALSVPRGEGRPLA
jgi:hypothetical protein